MWRLARLVGVLVASLVLCVPASIAGAAPAPGPYRGLGTWVDVFDYTARTQPEGAPLGRSTSRS
jgi:hypothetical protein